MEAIEQLRPYYVLDAREQERKEYDRDTQAMTCPASMTDFDTFLACGVNGERLAARKAYHAEILATLGLLDPRMSDAQIYKRSRQVLDLCEAELKLDIEQSQNDYRLEGDAEWYLYTLTLLSFLQQETDDYRNELRRRIGQR